MIAYIIHNNDNWPEGISDGLTLPCSICGLVPKFDYTVTDLFWNKVVPKKWSTSVICLGCLDKLSYGYDLGSVLIKVQFTGIGRTIVLKPKEIFYYQRR